MKAARTAASMRFRSSLLQPAIMTFKLIVTFYLVPPRRPGTDVGRIWFSGKDSSFYQMRPELVSVEMSYCLGVPVGKVEKRNRLPPGGLTGHTVHRRHLAVDECLGKLVPEGRNPMSRHTRSTSAGSERD